jgi:hypothetical protein
MGVVKKVMCPFDGIWYYNVPGLDRSKKPLVCPICGGVQVVGAGPDMTAGGQDLWVHKEIEREFITTEEAIKIFKNYCHKHYKDDYDAVRDILDHAWYSQHWSGGDYSYKRRDWMGDDLILAFNWYLDAVGRDLGLGYGRAKGLLKKEEIAKIEKELKEYVEERRHKKWDQQYKSKVKRDKKLTKQGNDFAAQMKVGDVWMVKFGGWWSDRGIHVLEIEKGSISGFYLDRAEKRVPFNTPKKEGYFYTKPSKYNSVKVGDNYVEGMFEWDGKTFIKTRTYETKMTKFLKRKVENPIIKKPK